MSHSEVPMDSYRGESPPPQGIYREATNAPRRTGVMTYTRDMSHLFSYDVAGGIAANSRSARVPIHTMQAAVMDVDKARALLDDIHRAYGVHTQVEGYLVTFDRALWRTAALNGTSVLIPMNKVFFKVGGEKFDYGVLHMILGELRRAFHRVYADFICMEVIDSFNAPFDEPGVLEFRTDMTLLATRKGCPRDPVCAVDVAEFCTFLSKTQHVLAAEVKARTLASGNNVPDRIAAPRVMGTADNYDSSLRTTAHAAEYHS